MKQQYVVPIFFAKRIVPPLPITILYFINLWVNYSEAGRPTANT